MKISAGPSANLSPIAAKQISIRERVIESLRAAIITGDMAPGQLYSAPVLAEMLQVSATPVREAMIDLAGEGLVEAVRNRGYRVLTVSEKSLDDMTELRALIEVPAVRQLAALEDISQFEALRPVAELIEQHAIEGRIIEFVQADITFHLSLLGLTGNEWIVEDVRRLRNLGRLYGLGRLAEAGTLISAAKEHHELLDLLIAHDGPAVGALMQKHISHIRRDWAGKHDE